ncbi:MAG: hypothetical protein ACJ786_04975, partial [Catenulispora sp.]
MSTDYSRPYSFWSPGSDGRAPAAEPPSVPDSASSELVEWVRSRVAEQLAIQARADEDAGRPPMDAQGRQELG